MSLFAIESQVYDPCLICLQQIDTREEHYEIMWRGVFRRIHNYCWDKKAKENG